MALNENPSWRPALLEHDSGGHTRNNLNKMKLKKANQKKKIHEGRDTSEFSVFGSDPHESLLLFACHGSGFRGSNFELPGTGPVLYLTLIDRAGPRAAGSLST